jgi:spore maturation protein CgeB
VGTMMLCEYSDDLATLFKPETDAVFFKTIPELIEKAKYYLLHDEKRRAIAENGQKRVLNDGHDVNSRARQLIETIKELVPDR